MSMTYQNVRDAADETLGSVRSAMNAHEYDQLPKALRHAQEAEESALSLWQHLGDWVSEIEDEIEDDFREQRENE